VEQEVGHDDLGVERRPVAPQTIRIAGLNAKTLATELASEQLMGTPEEFAAFQKSVDRCPLSSSEIGMTEPLRENEPRGFAGDFLLHTLIS